MQVVQVAQSAVFFLPFYPWKYTHCHVRSFHRVWISQYKVLATYKVKMNCQVWGFHWNVISKWATYFSIIRWRSWIHSYIYVGYLIVAALNKQYRSIGSICNIPVCKWLIHWNVILNEWQKLDRHIYWSKLYMYLH